MKLPQEIADKISVSEERFEALEQDIQTLIISLASHNIECNRIIHNRDEKIASLSSDKIIFMVHEMKIHDHKFTADDKITLQKRDNNPKEKYAIRVFANDKHVGYVAREYTLILRNVDNFENKPIKLIRNYNGCAKMEMICT
jgi:hypothetical protein